MVEGNAGGDTCRSTLLGTGPSRVWESSSTAVTQLAVFLLGVRRRQVLFLMERWMISAELRGRKQNEWGNTNTSS